jgi:predicted dehydrogenase
MEFVCEALRSGKHVLCEKPFGCNVNDAKIMLNEAEKSGYVHAVDFQFRMENGIRTMKKIISKKEIGSLKHMDIVWMTEGGADHNALWTWRNDLKQGGGVLGALGSHVMDYIQWLSANRVEYVFAHGDIMVKRRRDSSGNMRDVTAEDSMDIFCVFSEEITARIRIAQGVTYSPGHRVEIYGSQGRLVYSHEKPFTPEKMSLQIDNSSQGLRKIKLRMAETNKKMDSRILPFSRVARLFIDAIRGKKSPELPRFEQGYSVQQIMYAVRNSLSSGKIEKVIRAGNQPMFSRTK